MSYKFHEFKSMYDMVRPYLRKGTDYKTYYHTLIAEHENDIISRFQATMEMEWHSHQRPYYNMWPAIVPIFAKLKLTVSMEQLTKPTFPILVRFAEGKKSVSFEDKRQEYTLKSFMMTVHNPPDIVLPQLGVWMDFGELIAGVPALSYRKFPFDPNLTVEEALEKMPLIEPCPGVKPTEEFIKNVIRIAASLMLLDKEDNMLFQPDVIQADKEKYERTLDPKYIDKAHRRGKVGWDIGKGIELSPHKREGCMALYYTGPKKSIPKILWRRGVYVHGDKVKKLPTGYLDQEET